MCFININQIGVWDNLRQALKQLKNIFFPQLLKVKHCALCPGYIRTVRKRFRREGFSCQRTIRHFNSRPFRNEDDTVNGERAVLLETTRHYYQRCPQRKNRNVKNRKEMLLFLNTNKNYSSMFHLSVVQRMRTV